jgi:hypothetical protein
MADEIHSHTTGSFVVEIAIETAHTEMALELSAEKRRGLAAARVAGALRAKQDHGSVWTRAGAERCVVGNWWSYLELRRRIGVEGCGCRGSGADEIFDQIWSERWRDFVDNGECGQD